MFPCVIRQLLLVEDSIELFGISYALIETVALVRGIDYSATKITYHLEDHTGQIDAHFWLEGDDQVNQPQITTNCYARVVGSLRTSSENKVILVYHLEEVVDPNVVTTHLLEVLHVRFKAEAYKKRGVRSTLTTFKGDAMDTSEAPRSGGVDHGVADTTNPYALNPKNLMIYNAIKERSDSLGVNKRELKNKFTHMSNEELDNALDFMVQEGIIYTTVDADHYLTVE